MLNLGTGIKVEESMHFELRFVIRGGADRLLLDMRNTISLLSNELRHVQPHEKLVNLSSALF